MSHVASESSRPVASLPFSMRMFAEEASSPGAASAFRRIARALDQGSSWEEAVAQGGRRLPRFLRGTFAVAQATGELDRVVVEYLGTARRLKRARRRVLWAMLYPVILMLGVAILSLAVFTLIVPSFAEIFEDFGVELPAPTMALVAISRVAVMTWPVLLVGLVGGAGLLVAFLTTLRLPFSAPALRAWQRVPVIGSASALAGAAEFSLLLAILVRARVPMPEALRLTAGALRDANLRQGALRLAREVERGEGIGYAASILPNFGPRLSQLLRHQGTPDGLAEILKSHGELFALQAETQSEIAVIWMQPFLLVVVGLMGGFVVVSLFLPLVKLLNELS